MNTKFEEYKKQHPNWSDEQIWAAISIEMEADNVIENGGRDVNPNDPDLIKKIIIGAQNWLKDVLPDIFAKIAWAFEKLLTSIGDLVQRGLLFIVDAIAKILGRE